MSVLYAQVIVDIVHENVAHTFTYRIPDGMTLTDNTHPGAPVMTYIVPDDVKKQ